MGGFEEYELRDAMRIWPGIVNTYNTLMELICGRDKSSWIIYVWTLLNFIDTFWSRKNSLGSDSGGAINYGEKGQHKILVNYNKYR